MDKPIIHLKDIVMEDFINYKYPSMFLITAHCDWKCLKELNKDISICQNNSIECKTTRSFFIEDIVKYYCNNNITKAVVVGGLEPFLQFSELLDFIDCFRSKSNADIVIYTGYYKEEIQKEIEKLCKYKNIIIKFGRYIPDQKEHYDEVLGVLLASDNQYAERIS